MPAVLRDIAIPAFGIPESPPKMPASSYGERCREAWLRSGCDWLVVYADREHNANIAFLSGYDPRFEEALLLLGPRNRRILVVGNEGLGYAPEASLPGLETVLAQTMSLMGQDRDARPSLAAVLRDAGLKRGQSIGLVGWKYLEPAEWGEAAAGFYLPHAFVSLIAGIVGGTEALRDATPVLMHPETGLRAVIDADGVAFHEWGATRSSAAVWRMIEATRPGVTEFEAAGAMGYAGEVLTAHVMYATGDSSREVVGLRSPDGRTVKAGDGVTAGVGYWGGLSARAGIVAKYDEAFLKTAAAYFKSRVAWYETADIEVAGGAVFERSRPPLRSALNPGHLTGHDEWIHTPVRPGSPEPIVSGMPFQVDVIPTPLRRGWALNCEDGIVFADTALRAALRERYSAVFARIEARRRFVCDVIGVPIRDSILPLSSTPLCLTPFWLTPRRMLSRG